MKTYNKTLHILARQTIAREHQDLLTAINAELVLFAGNASHCRYANDTLTVSYTGTIDRVTSGKTITLTPAAAPNMVTLSRDSHNVTIISSALHHAVVAYIRAAQEWQTYQSSADLAALLGTELRDYKE